MVKQKCICIFNVTQMPHFLDKMRRKSLGREFLQLSKHDIVSIATVKLKARRHAFTLIRKIDDRAPSFTDVFFAYEAVDGKMERGLKEDPPGEYQVVMAYHPKEQHFYALFEKVGYPIIHLADHSIGELYLKMANSMFRVEKELLFDRLSIKDAKMVRAVNPMTRMVALQQDVLSLMSTPFPFEDTILACMRVYVQLHRKKAMEEGNSKMIKQRQLQEYLYGQYSTNTQIHLPREETDAIFKMIEHEDEMIDCVNTSLMDCEIDEESITLMMQQLTVSASIS